MQFAFTAQTQFSDWVLWSLFAQYFCCKEISPARCRRCIVLCPLVIRKVENHNSWFLWTLQCNYDFQHHFRSPIFTIRIYEDATYYQPYQVCAGRSVSKPFVSTNRIEIMYCNGVQGDTFQFDVTASECFHVSVDCLLQFILTFKNVCAEEIFAAIRPNLT